MLRSIFHLRLVNCVRIHPGLIQSTFLQLIDDRYIKDLTNKFFEMQLQHNDTIT
jgi:hypothetical protein